MSLGYDLEEAEVEEYSCLMISFENLDIVKRIFKKPEQYTAFCEKLQNLIVNYFESKELNVDYINNKYVIRCFKNLSFQSSVKTSLDGALSIAQTLSKVAYNLFKKKKVQLCCRMTIMKRLLEKDSRELNTDLEIKILKDGEEKTYYSGIEILTDQHVNKVISRKHTQEIVFSTQTDNNYYEFYKFPLATCLNIIEEVEEETVTNDLTKQELPQITIVSDEEKTETKTVDVSLIDINSEFIDVGEADLPRILQMILHNHCFVSIKHKNGLPLMSSVIRDIIQASSPVCVSVSCQEYFKTEPYAFLKTLLTTLIGLDFNDETRRAEALENLAAFDESGCLFRLFNNEINENISPDDAHTAFRNVFQQIIQNVSNIVIFIERFDLCDETSFSFIKDYIAGFATSNISFVVTTAKDYSVHKNIPNLLYTNKYKSITVMKSNFKDLLTKSNDDFSAWMNSDYMYKIRAISDGNVYYYKNIIQYMKDANVLYKNSKGEWLLNKSKTVIIPSSIDQLVVKRFQALPANEAFSICYLAFSGVGLSAPTIRKLGIEDADTVIKSLEEKLWVNVRNGLVFLENPDIVSKPVVESINDKNKETIFKTMQEHNLKINAFDIPDMLQIYNKSELALSHGDFNSYFVNSKKFLQLLKTTTYVTPEVKQLKKRVYAVLEAYITKYPSERIYPVIKHLQEDAVKRMQTDRIIDISSKILDSAMTDKNYTLAEKCVRYIINQVLNIKMSNESNELEMAHYYYLTMNIKILFNRGCYEQCLKSIDKMMSELRNPQLREKFEQSGILNIFKIALVYGAIANILLCKNDIMNYLRYINEMFGELEWFSPVLTLNELLFSPEQHYDENQNGISEIINAFIRAFSIPNFSYKEFAQAIHIVKIDSKNKNEIFWELLADTLIGYSYQKMDSTKALYIFEDVKKISDKKGIGFMSILSGLLIANYYYQHNEYEKSLNLLKEELTKIQRSPADNTILETICNIFMYNLSLAAPSLGIKADQIAYKINYAMENNHLGKLGFLLQQEEQEEQEEQEAQETQEAPQEE